MRWLSLLVGRRCASQQFHRVDGEFLLLVNVAAQALEVQDSSARHRTRANRTIPTG
jgi:hypothetical protein